MLRRPMSSSMPPPGTREEGRKEGGKVANPKDMASACWTRDAGQLMQLEAQIVRLCIAWRLDSTCESRTARCLSCSEDHKQRQGSSRRGRSLELGIWAVRPCHRAGVALAGPGMAPNGSLDGRVSIPVCPPKWSRLCWSSPLLILGVAGVVVNNRSDLRLFGAPSRNTSTLCAV